MSRTQASGGANTQRDRNKAMSRSFNARRPFVRKTRSIVRRTGEDLINKAGRASMERPTIEQLEPRKLLFSLTIDGSQADAFGQPMAEAYFAYFVPYLLSPDEPDDPNPGDTLDEDFNDEDVGQIFPGTQQVLQGSNILARNNNAQFVEIVAPTDATGQPQTDQTVMHSVMGVAGQSYSLATLADPNQPGGLRNVYVSLTFNVLNQIGNVNAGNNFGLLNGGLEIQTLFQGTVQRTFTQADLTAQNASGLGTFRVDAIGGDVGVFDEVRFVQTQTAFVDPGVVTSDFLLDDLV
ncbi:MAG TPA: hypothetical protein ENJ00_02325, partial [Phycisphaerales bacterium]|nr:hypothetical protein [Phycisphaerales bacterium]